MLKLMVQSVDWAPPEHVAPGPGVVIAKLEKGYYAVWYQNRWVQLSRTEWMTRFDDVPPQVMSDCSWGIVPSLHEAGGEYIDFIDHARLARILEQAPKEIKLLKELLEAA